MFLPGISISGALLCLARARSAMPRTGVTIWTPEPALLPTMDALLHSACRRRTMLESAFMVRALCALLPTHLGQLGPHTARRLMNLELQRERSTNRKGQAR